MVLEGVIINYRIAYTKEVIVHIPEIETKKQAGKLIGKKAIWTNHNKKEHTGKITGIHGSSGAIKIKFKRALPSNALGKIVKIYD